MTDGCGGQYKNKYNFTNACMHFEDFELDCELHFFATSHGKNMCDGVAGTLKRLVAKASLQRTTGNFITSPEQFLQFCNENIKETQCVFIKKSVVEETAAKLESERFAKASTLKGTLGYHCIIPINQSQVKAFQTSTSTDFKIHKVKQDENSTEPQVEVLDLKVNDSVICMYDGDYWGGMITDIDIELNDFNVNFMHPKINLKNPKVKYVFPQEEKDECWILESDIICKTDPPKFNGDRMMTYSYSKEDLTEVLKKLKNRS